MSETMERTSQHTIWLLEGEIVEESDLGSIRRATADNFPILQGMSIKRLVINPGAMRTPHWHANANELTAYSREVLAATFNTHIDDLPDFPFTKTDPLIVSRRNPVDEHAVGEE
jgi:oxalate decarboxylase/phosphoglucose isomerase-like protein (cupin superfamily)